MPSHWLRVTISDPAALFMLISGQISDLKLSLSLQLVYIPRTLRKNACVQIFWKSITAGISKLKAFYTVEWKSIMLALIFPLRYH
jgi:hypothetical protein